MINERSRKGKKTRKGQTHKVSNEPKGGKERKTNCGIARSGRGSH